MVTQELQKNSLATLFQAARAKEKAEWKVLLMIRAPAKRASGQKGEREEIGDGKVGGERELEKER